MTFGKFNIENMSVSIVIAITVAILIAIVIGYSIYMRRKRAVVGGGISKHELSKRIRNIVVGGSSCEKKGGCGCDE